MEQLRQRIIDDSTQRGCTNFVISDDLCYFISSTSNKKCLLVQHYKGIYDATIFEMIDDENCGASKIFPNVPLYNMQELIEYMIL